MVIIRSEPNKEKSTLTVFTLFRRYYFFKAFVFVILLIYGIFQVNNYYNFANSKTLNNTPVKFEVKEGESLYQITSRLIQEGIIKDKQVIIFPASQIYLKFNSINKANVQPGIHEIPAKIPINEMYNHLKLQECEQFKVTLKEGLRIEEFASIINNEIKKNGKKDNLNFSEEEFIKLARNFTPKPDLAISFIPPKNLEGYLFPDTYNFCLDVSAKQIIERLLITFDQKVYKTIEADLRKQNKNLHDVIKKASILEREAFNSNERKIIAGIIAARLERGEVLGIDATSQYANGYSASQKTWWVTGDELVRALQKDNDYNTRKRLGLPPTPISNPGLDSVLATLNPTKTDYFYYLHDDCGNIHYARTLSEHNLNVARYIGTGRC